MENYYTKSDIESLIQKRNQLQESLKKINMLTRYFGSKNLNVAEMEKIYKSLDQVNEQLCASKPQKQKKLGIIS